VTVNGNAKTINLEMNKLVDDLKLLITEYNFLYESEAAVTFSDDSPLVFQSEFEDVKQYNEYTLSPSDFIQEGIETHLEELVTEEFQSSNTTIVLSDELKSSIDLLNKELESNLETSLECIVDQENEINRLKEVNMRLELDFQKLLQSDWYTQYQRFQYEIEKRDTRLTELIEQLSKYQQEREDTIEKEKRLIQRVEVADRFAEEYKYNLNYMNNISKQLELKEKECSIISKQKQQYELELQEYREKISDLSYENTILKEASSKSTGFNFVEARREQYMNDKLDLLVQIKLKSEQLIDYL
jgi:DNA repair exonuclease SbcCD ATPase subunit